MARQSTYECDICNNSIQDPGMIHDVTFRSSQLDEGTKYVMGTEDAYLTEEVCPSCYNDIKTAINKLRRSRA